MLTDCHIFYLIAVPSVIFSVFPEPLRLGKCNQRIRASEIRVEKLYIIIGLQQLP